MDFFDMLWQMDQDHELADIRKKVEHVDRDLAASDIRKLQALSEENTELKLRLAVLIRLLIAKGVVSAQEYSTLLAEVRPNLRSSDTTFSPRRAKP